jgi:hypothetical protein
VNNRLVEALAKDRRIPSAVIDILNRRNAAVDRIRTQQFRPGKEAEEIRRADADMAGQLDAYSKAALEEVSADAESKLQAINAEDAARRNPFPKRDRLDTDAEYSLKLLKTLIERQEAGRETTATQTDVLAVNATDDPVLIHGIVDRALETRGPDSIAIIGRVAESRLMRLSQIEANSVLDGPISQVFAAVSGKMRAWRLAQQATSVDTRREAVRSARDIRRAEILGAIASAKEAFQVGGRPGGSHQGTPAADVYRVVGNITQ